MTYQNLIDAHSLQVNQAKDLIKVDIKTFFEANKESKDLLYLIKDRFSEVLNKFQQDYNFSVPAQLIGTIFEINGLHTSLSAYLDLVRYPLELVESLDKNNLHNPCISDEIL